MSVKEAGEVAAKLQKSGQYRFHKSDPGLADIPIGKPKKKDGDPTNLPEKQVLREFEKITGHFFLEFEKTCGLISGLFGKILSGYSQIIGGGVSVDNLCVFAIFFKKTFFWVIVQNCK